MNRIQIRRCVRAPLLSSCFAVLFLIDATGPGVIRAQAPSGGRNSPASARAFIADLGRKAVEELPAKKPARAELREQYRALLKSHFDVAGIGRAVFADYWGKATPTQRREALALYAEWIIDGLIGLLGRHSGGSFEALGGRAQGAGRYVVSSRVRSHQGDVIRVDWHVRPASDSRAGWRVTNLVAGDGNLIANHREEFQMMLEQAPTSAGQVGIEYLIEELRIRTAPVASP
jgi:ABC-type transporter MlaC component